MSKISNKLQNTEKEKLMSVTRFLELNPQQPLIQELVRSKFIMEFMSEEKWKEAVKNFMNRKIT